MNKFEISPLSDELKALILASGADQGEFQKTEKNDKGEPSLDIYQATACHFEILRTFKDAHVGMRIAKSAGSTKVQEYGDYVLRKGSISTPPDKIAVFIPLPLEIPTAGDATVAESQCRILYWQDKDQKTAPYPIPWQVSKTYIRIPGGSCIGILKAPIRFLMVRYPGKIVDDVEESGVADH